MLEEFTTKVVKKYVATEYPHLLLPAVLLARVISAKKLDDITLPRNIHTCCFRPYSLPG